jgi:pyruvate dehydrogenase E2 component (dihydrolipoamide acetyltransferase)
VELNNTWRKTASTIYEKPRDSKMLGAVEIDITHVEEFIAQKRKEGIKITLTHIFALVVGKAVKHNVPELNCYLTRGKIFQRKTVDAMISVLIGKNQMGSVIVKDIDNYNIVELSNYLDQQILDAKDKKGDQSKKKKNLLASVPWPFRKPLFNFIRWTSQDLGIIIPGIGIKPDAFGTFILSNIGTLGLDVGFGSLMPPSNLAFVMFMGKSQKKPIVVNDEIVIRKMISLTSVLDHRIIDGSHGGNLFRAIKKYLAEPEKL